MPGTLHFIAGKAGAGKTTLARRIASEQRAVFLCEDAWLAAAADPIATLDDYRKWSARCRAVMGPLIVQLLKLDVSVVIDFAGNIPKHRAWVRETFEAAGAPHVLHFIDLPDAVCLARVHQRNETQPEGVYFGHVSDALFHAVTQHFVPPAREEGFDVRRVAS